MAIDVELRAGQFSPALSPQILFTRGKYCCCTQEESTSGACTDTYRVDCVVYVHGSYCLIVCSLLEVNSEPSVVIKVEEVRTHLVLYVVLLEVEIMAK